MGRDPKKVSNIPELAGLEARRGDVTDPSSLTGVLEGADAVVGAVQFPNHPVEVPRRGLTYDRYDRQGTENLLEEARRVGVKRYVYLSGAGARVTSDKTWYRAKGLAERAVEDSGLEFAIVRPSWAYGPQDRALNRLAQIARFSPIVPQLGLHPQLVQPVYVDDIALGVPPYLRDRRCVGEDVRDWWAEDHDDERDHPHPPRGDGEKETRPAGSPYPRQVRHRTPRPSAEPADDAAGCRVRGAGRAGRHGRGPEDPRRPSDPTPRGSLAYLAA